MLQERTLKTNQKHRLLRSTYETYFSQYGTCFLHYSLVFLFVVNTIPSADVNSIEINMYMQQTLDDLSKLNVQGIKNRNNRSEWPQMFLNKNNNRSHETKLIMGDYPSYRTDRTPHYLLRNMTRFASFIIFVFYLIYFQIHHAYIIRSVREHHFPPV